MDVTMLSYQVKLKERENADTLLDAVQIMSMIANHPGVEVVTLKRDGNNKYPSFVIANHPGVEVATLERDGNKKYPSFDG